MQKPPKFHGLVQEGSLQDRLSPKDLLDIDLSDVEDAEQFIELINEIHPGRYVYIRDRDAAVQDEVNESDDVVVPLDLENIASDDTVSLYLREMSLTPILSFKEEINLAMRIEADRSA